MMSMNHRRLDDELFVTDGKKSSDDSIHLTADKSTQTELSDLRPRPAPTIDAECQTPLSKHSFAFDEDTCDKDHSKAPLADDLTSSCSIEDNECESATKQEEYQVLARIKELKETRDALLAEKRVILMKIEELKLRQEVRTLLRDVSKARDELNALVSREEKEMPLPRIPQVPLSELANTQNQRSVILDSDKPDNRGTHNNELTDMDGGASHVLSKNETDTTDEREECVPDGNNNSPSCTIEVMHQTGDTRSHSFDTMRTSSFQEETVFDESDSDLQGIKEFFSRNANLRSAPAVLFGARQEEEIESFIKASSYDGVEMLSVCEQEGEDVPNRAFDEAIERLAGGRLDVLEADKEDQKDKESSGESEVISVSLDDEDEYTHMLDSIPLNPTTPEVIQQEDEDAEDTADLFLDAQISESQEDREEGSSEIHLPITPVFPEPPAEQDMHAEMSAIDSSASSVFCSPRNGRSSPRSPSRQLLDPEMLRNQHSPEMDVSVSDPPQTHRLTSPIPDALITASSCSSCWVQFSQTDRGYVQNLIAKFLMAFCHPHPPECLSCNELPIPLRTFTAIERESGSSLVQEAFDRAIFDTVNQRLAEIYRCLGRLKMTDSEVDESKAWQVPSYERLLDSLKKAVFSTTDCDADPLAAYSSKEQIIEQMLKQDAHHLHKHNNPPRFVLPARNH